MYESYFGVEEKPFSIAPDPRFVYLSPAHEEALAHLEYGVREAGGFVLLTGEVGTGKTTLLRTLLQQLPENVDLAVVLNPKLSPTEFLATLCDELHIPLPDGNPTLKVLVDRLNRHLLDAFAAGRRTVVVMDEAQGLSPDVLEQVRLLTNLETTREKLLEIILVGQPELRETLARTDLRQLSQRITARYHLKPLTRDQVHRYVAHRLKIAGADGGLFSRRAVGRLAKVTEGIPRLINEVADRALLGAFASEKRVVDRRMVSQAAREVMGEPMPRRRSRTAMVATAAAIVAAIGAAGAWWGHERGLEWSALLSLQKTSAESAAAQRPILVTIQAPPPAAALETAEVDSPTGTAVDSPPTATGVSIEDQPPLGADWLEGMEATFTQDSAWERLFRAWSVLYVPGGGDACQQAEIQGLQCLASASGWEELAGLGRPAMLRLDLPEAEVYVTVTGLDDTTMTVDSDIGPQQLMRTAVDPYWAKDFVFLWRPQGEGERRTLHPGDTDTDVLWLRERLAQITGRDVEPLASSDIYDEPLSEEVRMFQQRNGLVPDGIVGPQTQLRLNLAVPTEHEPRLGQGS